MPSPGFVFALSEDARTVAVAYPELGVVRLYPKLLSDASLDDAKELKIVGLPSGLAYQKVDGRGVFVVLTSDDRTVRLLDEKTFEVVGQFALKDGRPCDLAVPTDPASAYAYYTVMAEGSHEAGRIGRIDLKNKRDDGIAETGDESSDIACSADGTIVYGRRPGVSPSGYRAWRFTEPASPGGPPRARNVRSMHDDAKPYVADPFNTFVASGAALWSFDFAKRVADLGAPVRTFMRTQPVALASDDYGGVVAFSMNTYQKIGALPLPDEDDEQVEAAAAAPAPKPGAVRRVPPQQQQRQQKQKRTVSRDSGFVRFGNYRRPYETFISVDEAHGTLVAAWEQKLLVAPLSALRLPKEPMLFIQVTGESEGQVGRELMRKVVKVAPAAQVALAGAPEGMKLDGDKLTWTPTAAQVGLHRVRFRVTSGQTERAHEMELIVRRPSIGLPFAPDIVTLSPDGSRAVAMGLGAGGTPSRRRGGGDGQEAPSRVLVVDLEKQTIIADRVLPYQATEALAVSKDAAYVAAQGSDAVYVLSLADLKDVRRIFTSLPRINRLSVFGEVLSAYGYGGGGDGRSMRYRLPDLQPIDRPDDRNQRSDFQSWPFPERVDDGWLVNGVVVDAAGKPRLLAQPADIFDLTSSPNTQRKINGASAHDTRSAPIVNTWGVAVRGQLQRMTGQAIAQISGLDHLILTELPVVVSLTNEQVEVPSQRESHTMSLYRNVLTLRDLVEGQARQTITLSNEPPQQDYTGGRREQRPRILSTPGRLVVSIAERLYIVPMKEIDAAKFPMPVHFEQVQETLVLPTDKPLRLACKASGGNGELTYAAANDMPGVTVDEKTGMMTIDPAPFLARAPEFIMQVTQNRGGFQRGTTQPGDVNSVLRTVAAAARSRFKELTGREPEGYPVAVPADVLVRDSEQQTAVLNRVVLLDVPFDRVIARLDEQRQQQEQARRQQEAMRAQQMTVRSATGADDEAKSRRIAELERRVIELEAQNKLLRDLVGQPRGPSTAPVP